MLFESLDWKIVFSISATTVGIISFLPYLWQIFKRQTEPHAYTWLVWTITQGTVAAGIWYGGGGHIQSIGMMTAAFMALMVFLLSFKYGTKNITKGDTLILLGALAAIVIWWQLKNPVLAVMVATLIDLIGYIPTYRKSFQEPWSENLLAWVGYLIAPALGLLGLYEYNLMTATYSAVTVVANTILVVLLFVRRRSIPKPS